jgi:flavin-dependent dehydrogenase
VGQAQGVAVNSCLHDVVVIGASVAGSAAAATLAAAELDVVLIEARQRDALSSRHGCLSARSEPLLEAVGVSVGDASPQKTASCDFFLGDFSKTITPAVPKESGFLVDAARLAQIMAGLVDQAPSGHVVDGVSVSQIQPEEDRVAVITADGATHYSKLAILATGCDSGLGEQVGLAGHNPGSTGVWCAEYKLPAGPLAKPGHVDFVLGLGRGEGMGYRICHEDMLTVGASVAESGHKAIADLMRISNAFVSTGRLATDWQTQAAGTTARWCPAGAALETETHVGKRVVAIGEAGGFIAGYTSEFIYPAIWGAHLAAHVVQEALLSKQTQDQLRDFDSTWRMTMAEYLRPPNTDAQSLLPLVFSNRQMADKMLESLLLGINF